jgi:protein-L-isoaspartate(D-aspartate) O-methyltransferase
MESIRRWFAEDLRLRAPVTRNLAIIEAFAAVPRERFLGAGPWRLLPGFGDPPIATPDADPRWLYHDLVVSIDPARNLNNGQPSLWARTFDHLDLRRGERVMQVGAATGYYSAVLAEIVGREGRVAAVEHDAELAARARGNLEPWPQVDVVAGDGRTHDPGKVDAVIVCAGSTHPAPLWLDRLAEGGRLVMPVTSDNWWGFMLRAIRRGDGFDASSPSRVGIFPCIGGRDEDAAKRLQQALENIGNQPVPIQALHRGEPPADVVGKVWYSGPGFWLERRGEPTSEIRVGL